MNVVILRTESIVVCDIVHLVEKEQRAMNDLPGQCIRWSMQRDHHDMTVGSSQLSAHTCTALVRVVDLREHAARTMSDEQDQDSAICIRVLHSYDRTKLGNCMRAAPVRSVVTILALVTPGRAVKSDECSCGHDSRIGFVPGCPRMADET